MSLDDRAAVADPPVHFDDLLDDLEPLREEEPPPAPPAASESSFLDTEPDGSRTYRGGSIEEIVPRIRTELGPDAVILRQREGLTGGVGGFFQRRCVEVQARAAGPRIDLYDTGEPVAFVPDPVPEPPAPPAPPTAIEEGLSSPGIEALVRQAQPFAEHLTAAESDPAPAYVPATAGPQVPEQALHTVVAPGVSLVASEGERPAKADALERKLADAGLAPGLAADIVDSAVAHGLPFAGQARISTVVRDALARRIPVDQPSRAAGRTIAVVGAAGAGKTAAVAAIASAYASGSHIPVICLSLAPRDRGESLAAALRGTGVQPMAVATGKEAAALIAGARGRALLVIDTPSLSPADAKALGALRRDLRAVGDVEVHLALRAATSRPAAGEQAGAYAALGASRLVMTHLGETSHLGPVVDLAVSGSTPLSFVSEGAGHVAPADAAELARRILG